VRLYEYRTSTDVYWTLTVEISFYFWIFLLLALKRIHLFEVLALALVAFAIYVRISGLDVPTRAGRLLILDYIHLLPPGVCFCQLWLRASTWDVLAHRLPEPSPCRSEQSLRPR
jgi:peptidoglycan/LPS O-acetylase OafA/YrhL